MVFETSYIESNGGRFLDKKVTVGISYGSHVGFEDKMKCLVQCNYPFTLTKQAVRMNSWLYLPVILHSPTLGF